MEDKVKEVLGQFVYQILQLQVENQTLHEQVEALTQALNNSEQTKEAGE